MARTFVDPSHGTPAPILIRPEDGRPVTVPDASLLFSADFQRDHGDLVLRNPGSPDVRIVDYFDAPIPNDLQSPEGAVIRGPTVARLAGPEAPGQYAQAGAATATDPIGQVETLSGDATVQRADGTVETLGPGDKIFPDDVLQTGADGRLAVTFVDGTIFTLSPASRMVVDELIYDPAGQGNFGGFNLIQGSFVFIAGQVAKTGGMDVSTPSATMGIKGTTVLVEIGTDNGVATAQVTLLRDPDGDVGRVELFDLSRNLIATISEANASWVVSTVDGATREVERAAAPDDADRTIIADAVAAYQSAFGRVDRGGSFVELDNVLRGGSGGRGGPGGDGINLDSTDDEELPELAPPPEAPLPGDGSFDDGRNGFLPLGPIRVTGDDSGSVVDGGTTVADGRLDATEPDAVTNLIWSGSAEGTYGTFTIAPAGDWRYVAKPAIARLDEGETAEESFVVTTTDGTGQTAQQTITITVVGAGDAPEAVTPASAAQGVIDEFPGATTGGQLVATDPDACATLAWSGAATGAYGSFSIAPDGTWSYVAGPAVTRLAEGQRGTESFTATVTDQTGRTATQVVTVTITGNGDGPVSTTTPANASGTVTDGGTLLASGTLTATDPDAGAVVTWSGAATGAYGTFSVAPDGAWTYTAAPSLRTLAQGERVVESFTATVTDDTGRTATQRVTVSLTGANDSPVSSTAAGNATGRVTDGGVLVASGTLAASDPDAGAALTWTGGGTSPYGTFAVQPDGGWTFTGNGAIDALARGATVTESFVATVTDEWGATATQTVVVTVVGTNDAPVTSDGEFDTRKDEPITGTLFASDVDAGDLLTFSLGPRGPANGTVAIAADGSFTYTPNAGFQGLDTFDFSVSDGQGGTATSRATVAVVSESGGSGGATVSLDIEPAGTVLSTASPVEATGVNLVIALDRSGSIGASEWQVQVNQVADALQALAARFAGAATSVDVRIVAYSTTATSTPTYSLTDPALIAAVRGLPYTGGTTNYAAALAATETFFDSQPQDEANFLYFITDGQPTDSTWPTVLARLTDEATKGYDVQIEAFGIGGAINFTTLSRLDPAPELLDGASDLTDAFTATPLFSADLVSLRVELIADGMSRGVIATEDSAAVVSSGLVTSLSLADIAGIADLLGTSNRISATASYDLDGDPATAEVELFASNVFRKADAAHTLTGTGGSDLLFGSDAGDDLTGGAGNDILVGFGGNDVIRPGAGIDTVRAGAGNDRIVVAAVETAPAQGTERLDGGAGRDTLDVDFAGNVNTGLVDLVDLRGIEVIDMQNGQSNALRLTLSDVLGLSDETDSAIGALLGGAVPNARTILGDSTDTLVLEGARKTGTVADGAGNSFDIYRFEGGSDVLATLAVDADVTVATQAAGT
jgi:VCBS repeat-containing protein